MRIRKYNRSFINLQITVGIRLTDDLSRQEIYDSLKNACPGTIVKMNNGCLDGTQICAFPTDVLNGEITLPPASGHNPIRKVGGVTYYIPFEYELTSQKRLRKGEDPVVARKNFANKTWFRYGPGKSFVPSVPIDPDTIYRAIATALRRNASTVMLSTAPDYTGSFRKEDIDQLMELGAKVKPLFEKNK